MNKKRDWNNFYKKKKSAFFHSSNRLSSLIREYLFNRIVYAFMTALFIGVTFGFLLLQFVEQDTVQHVNHHTATMDNNVENKVDKQEGTSTSMLETVTFQVIQTGVFQNEENAKDWVSKHATKKLPFFIWESNEQYYVLTEPFLSANADQKTLDLLSELGIDAFVKEWHVEKEITTLSDKDVAKLDAFITLWQKSLSAVDQQHSLTNEWKEWVESSKKESATIITFQEKVHHILFENTTKKSLSKQQLLEILFEFEQSDF